MNFSLSAPQDCQRKTFILLCLLEVDLGTELLQRSSLRRGTGQEFPPRGVRCCPVMLRRSGVGLSLYSSEKSIPDLWLQPALQ